MKKITFTCSLALCLVPLLIVAAPDDFATRSPSGWFDFEGCAFCETLGKDPALLAHTTWENHPIRNGMMNIMTVDSAYAPAMARAEGKMHDLSEGIQSGAVNPAELHLCGHCENFGALIASGVAVEEVRGAAAVVSLFTSDDPEVVAGLHEQARRDTAERDAMTNLDHNHAQ